MDSREPSMVQGCYNDDGAYGHNTYWLSETELKKHFAGHPARRFTQAQYDEKSINCSPYWMYAAFCTWDGGRMPTTAEIQKVWPATSGNQVYPWGQYATTKPVAATDAPVAPAAPTNALIAGDYTNTVNLTTLRAATPSATSTCSLPIRWTWSIASIRRARWADSPSTSTAHAAAPVSSRCSGSAARGKVTRSPRAHPSDRRSRRRRNTGRPVSAARAQRSEVTQSS